MRKLAPWLAFLLAAFVVVALLLSFLPRMVSGRVVLRTIEGQSLPAVGAQVKVYPEGQLKKQLAVWIAGRRASTEEKEAALRAAREIWQKNVAQRDEASRILQVALEANALDLDSCRARQLTTAKESEEAFARVQELSAALEQEEDPAGFVQNLPPTHLTDQTGVDGSFSIKVPLAQAQAVIVSCDGEGERLEKFIWLEMLPPFAVAPLDFSNGNILTFPHLLELAGNGNTDPKSADLASLQTAPVAR